MIADFLTVNKVIQLLSSSLPAGEELEFVGHGVSHLWGFIYYVGSSDSYGVIAKLSNECRIEQPAIMPIGPFEAFIREKKIDVFPFDVPPLPGEKERAAFLDMWEAIRHYSEPDESFVTLCRASKFGYKNILIGITDKRIMIFKLKPKRELEIVALESSSPLADVEEITILRGLFGAESLPTRVPYIDYGRILRISFSNGKVVKYGMTNTSGHAREY